MLFTSPEGECVRTFAYAVMLYTAVQFCLYCELRGGAEQRNKPQLRLGNFHRGPSYRAAVPRENASKPENGLSRTGVDSPLHPACWSWLSSEPTILLSVSGTEKYLNQCYSRRFVLCVGDEKTRAPAKANSNGI